MILFWSFLFQCLFSEKIVDIIDITYAPKISLTYKSLFKHIKIVWVYLQLAKIFVDYNNARMPFYIYMRFITNIYIYIYISYLYEIILCLYKVITRFIRFVTSKHVLIYVLFFQQYSCYWISFVCLIVEKYIFSNFIIFFLIRASNFAEWSSFTYI